MEKKCLTCYHVRKCCGNDKVGGTIICSKDKRNYVIYPNNHVCDSWKERDEKNKIKTIK